MLILIFNQPEYNSNLIWNICTSNYVLGVICLGTIYKIYKFYEKQKDMNEEKNKIRLIEIEKNKEIYEEKVKEEENQIMNIMLYDTIYNCGHYIRGCKYLAHCCDKIFNCRLCHDEEYENDLENSHKMNNPDTKKIVCKNCDKMQDFKQYCESCGLCFGRYFCDKCKFVDDDEKKQYYHCDECGICRRGKREEYEHCKNCERCFHIGHNQKCKNTKNLNRECPICFDDLFYSTDTTIPLSCGHNIHTKCFISSLKSGNQKCPICRKTIAKDPRNDAFLKLMINTYQMPEEFKDKKVDILCQDCEQKSNVNFNLIAMFCPNCDSHNTTQI